IWFSNVDLPTLGRPTMATKPQRLSGFSGRVISFIRESPRRAVSAHYGPLPAPPPGGYCQHHWLSAPAKTERRLHERFDCGLLRLPILHRIWAAEIAGTAGIPA